MNNEADTFKQEAAFIYKTLITTIEVIAPHLTLPLLTPPPPHPHAENPRRHQTMETSATGLFKSVAESLRG